MRLELHLADEIRHLELDTSQKGQTLSHILRHENLPLNTRCGERALCRACFVEVRIDGRWEPIQGCRLAVREDLAVRIPPSALLAYAPQILSDYRVNVPFALDPPFGREGLGVAIDIGTTTVAVSLVDLATGAVVGRSAAFNRQMNWGDDVLTRINLCSTDPNALGALKDAIVMETLVPLVREALGERPESEIRGYVLAGNTTMLHLVSGTDPSPLGFSPFTPAFIDHRVHPSEAIGLAPAGVPVHLLPGAAAYVGSDITAGVFASGLVYDEGPSLLVDVGTNGEIVLKSGGRILGCATAAGPAFEGSGLACGMRAGDGAIAHLGEACATYETIGDAKPIGLCGSAYVDFLHRAFEADILGPSGRLNEHPHIERNEFGSAFRVAYGQGKRPILVSEHDVARLLQAKAAIAAGITILLQRAGVDASEIQTLYLAGGFGMHLDLDSAIGCGLLPGFRKEQIQLVGNTSLAGAYLATVDGSVLPELSRIGEGIEIVELNLDPDFEDTYIDHLMLGGA